MNAVTGVIFEGVSLNTRREVEIELTERQLEVEYTSASAPPE